MARFDVGDRVQYQGRTGQHGTREEIGTVTAVHLKSNDRNLAGDGYEIITDKGKRTEWYDKEVIAPPAPPIDHSPTGKTKKRFGLF